MKEWAVYNTTDSYPSTLLKMNFFASEYMYARNLLTGFKVRDSEHLDPGNFVGWPTHTAHVIKEETFS